MSPMMTPLCGTEVVCRSSARAAWGKAAGSCPGCNRGRLYTLSEIRSLAKGESGT